MQWSAARYGSRARFKNSSQLSSFIDPTYEQESYTVAPVCHIYFENSKKSVKEFGGKINTALSSRGSSSINCEVISNEVFCEGDVLIANKIKFKEIAKRDGGLDMPFPNFKSNKVDPNDNIMLLIDHISLDDEKLYYSYLFIFLLEVMIVMLRNLQ